MKLTFPFLLSIALLTGCSSHTGKPEFTASGYLADQGSVRIWRKDSQPQLSHMLTIYTPFDGSVTETTDYHWQDGKLIAVERHSSSGKAGDVTLRFDQTGKLNFMQRQLDGRKESLSEDDVALYQFDARRMLQISDDLQHGKVRLKQGRWSASGIVSSCQGDTLNPSFGRSAQNYLIQRRAGSSAVMGIAWLETAGDTQLLLVSNEDLCINEPQEADFSA